MSTLIYKLDILKALRKFLICKRYPDYGKNVAHTTIGFFQYDVQFLSVGHLLTLLSQ